MQSNSKLPFNTFFFPSCWLVWCIHQKPLTCCPPANQFITFLVWKLRLWWWRMSRRRLKKSAYFKVKTCWNTRTLEASASWAARTTSSCLLCKARDSKFLLMVIRYRVKQDHWNKHRLATVKSFYACLSSVSSTSEWRV